MKTQLNKTQMTMAAITFAEAGEWNTAREFLSMAISKVKVNLWDSVFSAAAFAEAGEWNTAREFLPRTISKVKVSLWDSIFSAAAFAEEGLHDVALQIVYGAPQKRSRRASLDLSDLGIRKLHLVYGTVMVDA
ncbi:MAG: hypothetical protein A2521_13155 [Deltaproteobacteria bacterium RIFOXYD12_FULL_57_12]|nr:MAG: hypothetical protein A2521_13155 [Deltaproteobacteria bacterium RIFOXYD12_FULL_57_12]